MQLRSVLLWGLASSQRKRKLSSRAVINTVSAYPNSTLPLNQDLLANDECEPLSIPVEQQCSHVQATCPQSDTLLHVSYPDAYFCAPPAARPFAFVGLLLWLLFLFSFIGIAASDFFIPNLATLADVFGLDDNIAGVTFLAFGNGSPDLFSTLSAMRAGSGSLAIGELIGAASFIVSVVAGSMCVIQSFHVNPVPFLRDVGFFAVSMGMLFWILFDGLIEAWEAALLAGLYICYVIVVVLSTWWDKRRERKERSLHEARRAFERDDIPSIFVEPYQDEPQPDESIGIHLATPGFPPRQETTTESERRRTQSMPSGISFSSHRRSKSYPHPMQHHAIASSNSRPGLARSPSASTSYFTHHNHTLPNPSSHHDDLSRSHHSYLDHTIFHPHNTFPRRPSHSHQSHQRLQSFSLLGALEFRNVVTSLQRESGVAVLAAFDSPVSPSYVGGHYDFPRRLSRRSSRSSTSTRREGDIRSSDEMELQGGEAGSENVAPRSPSIGRSHSPSTRRQRNGLLAPEAADDTLAPGASPPERHSHRRDASSSTLSSSSTAPHADNQLTIIARRNEGAARDSRPTLTLDFPASPSPSHPPALVLPTPSPLAAAAPLSAPALTTNEPDSNTFPQEHETTTSTLVPQSLKPHSTPLVKGTPTRKRWTKRIKRIVHVLFPTLVNLKGKTTLGKSAAVLAAPAVFFLTLTLPVVVLREGGGLHGSGPDSRGLSEPSIQDEDEQGHRNHNPTSARRRSEAEDRVREGRLIDLESPLPRSGDALERSYHSLMDWTPLADESNPEVDGERDERQHLSLEDEQLTLRIDDTHNSSDVPAAVPGAGTVRPQLQLNDDPIPTTHSNDEDEAYETSSPTLEASNLPTSHRRSSSGTYGSSSSSEAPPTPRLFNKYLTAAQLIFGPAFCIAVCFISMPRLLPWLLLAAFVVGVSGAMLVVVFGDGERRLKGKVRLEGPEDERFLVGGEEVLQLHAEEDDDLAAVEMLSQQSEKTGIAKVGVGRLALCLMGFTVAMVWIMAIADEVVQVLTTFGLIFGLSDAIIGLTIFAIGNSLADFVADITVAQFAPIMGFSACFGGPMLNILLGIGLSGTFVIAQTGEAYPVEFDNTLLVSCVGLLALLVATLIWVPWNGYFLDRRWGLVLILAYACIMAANVLVEIFFSSRS